MLSHKKLLGYRQLGFTMIELLVSVFIIVLISSVFMVNYHNTSKRSELNVAMQKLASDIRVAQNNTLGAKTYNGLYTPPGGWGIHFFDKASNPNQYVIFADKAEAGFLNGDKIYDVGEAVETKNLPVGVTISSLSPANTVGPVNTLDIIFFPPDPVTYINGKSINDNQYATASITLKENINNSTGTVTVNFFGLIDVQ